MADNPEGERNLESLMEEIRQSKEEMRKVREELSTLKSERSGETSGGVPGGGKGGSNGSDNLVKVIRGYLSIKVWCMEPSERCSTHRRLGGTWSLLPS